MQTTTTTAAAERPRSRPAAARQSGIDSSRPPCRFFLLGKCKFGDACTFSHDSRDGRLPVCSFFENTGNCRYGNDCKFLHGTTSTTSASSTTSSSGGGGGGGHQQPFASAATSTVQAAAAAAGAASAAEHHGRGAGIRSSPGGTSSSRAAAGGACGDGGSSGGAAAAAATTEEEEERLTEVDDTESKCGICLENIPASGKRFGLLNCDHVYCLDCLRTWRRSKGHQKDISRTCPECRKVSFFLVPSKEHLKGRAKLKAIQAYKKGLSKLPCKYHKPTSDGGDGDACPFGARCFYAHLDENGNDVKGRVPPAPPAASSRRSCPYLRGGRGASRAGSSRRGGGGRYGVGGSLDDFHVLYPFEEEADMEHYVPGTSGGSPFGRRQMSVIMRLQQLMLDAEDF